MFFLFLGSLHFQNVTAQTVQTETNQTETELLVAELTSIGFENIAVRSTDSDLTIAYENRVYRSQHRALSEVLKAVAQSDVTADSLHVLMLYREQPMSQVSTSLADVRAMVAGEISYQQWQQGSRFTMEHGRSLEELRGVERVQRSRFRPEIPIGLGMRYDIGSYSNPYRFAFDLQPELRVPLQYGITANFRLAVPLYNNFDDRFELNNKIRPSLITLSIERRLTDRIYGGATTGWFAQNRQGWHAMLKGFLMEEILSVTVEGGQTMFSELTGLPFIRSFNERDFNFYTVTADYRWRRHDLNIRAQYGKYLYEDVGFQFDVHRHFGDAIFGFFFIDTRFGNNYGFKFSLPFPQRKSLKAGPVRVRAASHFPVTYRYQRGFQGRVHETGITLDRALMEFYPSFLRKEMGRWF